MAADETKEPDEIARRSANGHRGQRTPACGTRTGTESRDDGLGVELAHELRGGGRLRRVHAAVGDGVDGGAAAVRLHAAEAARRVRGAHRRGGPVLGGPRVRRRAGLAARPPPRPPLLHDDAQLLELAPRGLVLLGEAPALLCEHKRERESVRGARMRDGRVAPETGSDAGRAGRTGQWVTSKQ